MMSVSFDPRRGRYQASINLHIGMFDSEEEAAEAAKEVKESRALRAFRSWMDQHFDRPGMGRGVHSRRRLY